MTRMIFPRIATLAVAWLSCALLFLFPGCGGGSSPTTPYTPASITSQPASTSVVTNAPASFSVVAAGVYAAEVRGSAYYPSGSGFLNSTLSYTIRRIAPDGGVSYLP